MFTSVWHSFASIIDNQLSRKATLMFQDVSLFELFQQSYLILFYFHLNQVRNYPAKTYGSGKKHITLSQCREGNALFSDPLSSQSACAMSWKQTQLFNKQSYFLRRYSFCFISTKYNLLRRRSCVLWTSLATNIVCSLSHNTRNKLGLMTFWAILLFITILIL